MRYKLKLTITKTRRQVLVEQAANFRFHCPVCRAETEMFTELEAIALSGVENCLLEGLVADGRIHTTQTPNGNLRICKNSLFQIIRNGEVLD